MSCLVIGGNGFIGQWVVRHLLGSGRDVVVLGRSSNAAPSLDRLARYVSGDYGHKALLCGLLSEADEVIDLAYSTVPKSSFEDPIFDIQGNLPQSVNLLQAVAAQGRIKKVVMVSSGGTVYGHAQAPKINEDHPTNPVSPYGITKLAIEKYGLMFHRLFGIPLVVVRPGNAYGEGQRPYRGQGLVATAAASMLDGKPLSVFGGDQIVRDYIHVEDIAAGIVAALDFGLAGHCYNTSTGVGRTTNEIITMVGEFARRAGRRVEISNQPLRPFDVLTNVLDSTRLAAASGWQPQVDLARGIERTWHWLEELKSSGGTA